MTKINSSYLSSDIDLDDVIFDSYENDNKPKKKKNKNKKKNKESHKVKNNKVKKKNNKKDKEDKSSKKYKYKYKKGILEDVVNVDVKSKINMDITDASIVNGLNTAYNIVKCIVTKGRDK